MIKARLAVFAVLSIALSLRARIRLQGAIGSAIEVAEEPLRMIS